MYILLAFLLFFIFYFRMYIIQTAYNIFFVYKSYYLIKKINNNNLTSQDIKEYKQNVNKVGVFAIKLVQWGLNRFKIMSTSKNTSKLLEELNVFYENCPFHSDEYTKKKFKDNFNFEIDKKYKLKRLASGSIAQVYLLEDYETGIKYAMKVVHPEINNKIYISKIFFKFLFCINSYISKFNISFDLTNFFLSIEEQINLCNEANYISKFYNKYENNEYIVIPKVIKYCSDIIIMTYEEGIFYDDLNISEYKKGKIISLLEMFLLNTMIIDEFIHADLHNGNWKVRKMENSNDYQLIIYDFGICLDISKFNIKEFYKNILNNDYENLVNVICDGIVNRKDIEHCKKVILQTLNEDVNLKYMDMNNIIETIIKLSYKLDIIFDSDYLTFLLLTINFQSVASDYSHTGGASSDYKGYDNIQSDFVKKSTYPYIINLCKHYNIFLDLSEYLQEFLNQNQYKGSLFDDIDDRLKITRNISFSDIDSSSDSDSD